MKPSSLIAVVVIVSGFGTFSALAAGETTFLPGYYETVTRIAGDPEPEIQRDCVTAAEARTRTLERALAEMTEGRCTYGKR